MSSSRADSRTNSVYVDAPEIASEDEASCPSTSIHQAPHPTTTETSATTGLHNTRSSREPSAAPVTPIPQEDDDEEEEDEDEDEYLDDSESEELDDPSTRGRSRDRDENLQEDDDDEEIIVMQVDPSTGLQRATSQTRSQSLVSSISSHMRRQQRRMASSNRVSSRSGASRGTSSGTSPSGSGSSNPSRTPVAPVVDERAQSELRRKIMDIQRDPTISFADKAGMIQVLWLGLKRSYVKGLTFCFYPSRLFLAFLIIII